MIILFSIALVAIALILPVFLHKSEWNIYLSGFCFIGALFCISHEINNDFILLIKRYFVISDNDIKLIYLVQEFMIRLCEHSGIILAIVFCLRYSVLFSKSKTRIITLFAFLYAIISFIVQLFVKQVGIDSDNRAYYFYLVLWGGPMIVIGISMLFIAYLKERNQSIIRQRFINLVFSTLLIIGGTLNLLILKAIGINSNIILINLIVIVIEACIFSVLAVWKGALGVRISIERQSVIDSIDRISEGTAIFNHTLKNEVGKIAIVSGNLKKFVGQENPNFERGLENIEVVENTISNLSVMIKRMQDFSGNIRLQDSICSIEEILDKVVDNVSLFIEEKNISLIKNYSYKILLKCDETHLVESMTNILKNACEALSTGGQIKIGVYGNRNVLYICIVDNGPGIKKEYVSKVFEPFFTTKDGSRNFGFGLSYAYKVLNKHHGGLSIYSKENVGTTVTLSLPGYRIKSNDKKLPVRF